MTGPLPTDTEWFVGPDLGAGTCTAQTQTCLPFERFTVADWTLPFQLRSTTGPVASALYGILDGLGEAVGYLSRAVAYGAIVFMQWVLGLTGLFSDNETMIGNTISTVAVSVFWPFAGLALAIGVVMLTTRKAWGDLITLIAIAVVAMGMMISPTSIAGAVDATRAEVSDAAMRGYSAAGPAGQSSAGFTLPAVPTDHNGSVRKLSDAMWNTFATGPWCLAAFGSMESCAKNGADYMTGSPRWREIQYSQGDAAPPLTNIDVNPIDGTTTTAGGTAVMPGQTPAGQFGQYKDTCNPDLASPGPRCDLVRGESFTRLGAVFFGLVVTIPLSLTLGVLCAFLLMALIMFMVLLLLGPITLVLWIIPGKCRAIGWKWFELWLGSAFSAVIVTALVGVVMVLSAILAQGTVRYGPGSVAIMTLVLFFVALKVRAMLDVTGLTGLNPFVGMALGRAAVNRGRSLVHRGTQAVTGAGKLGVAAAGAGVNQVMNPNSFTSKAARSAPHTMARLRQSMAIPGNPAPAPGRPMAHTTPYRTAPVPTPALGSGFTVGSPAPAASWAPAGHAYPPHQGARPIGPGPGAAALPNATPKRLELAAPAPTTTAPPPGPTPANEQRGHRQLPPESRQAQDPPRTFTTGNRARADWNSGAAISTGPAGAVLPNIRVSRSEHTDRTVEARKASASRVVTTGHGDPHTTTRKLAPYRQTGNRP